MYLKFFLKKCISLPIFRRAIGVVCQHHPNQPMMAIRPQWIIDCLRQQKLLNPSLYPPIIIQNPKPPPKKTKTKMVSNIFQGAVFLWSITTDTNKNYTNIVFDSNKIEQCILENGGHMASSPHVRQVLQTSSTRRVCFVIRSISTDVTTKEEQKIGQWCDMVSVTPLWILSCVQQKSDISPTKFFPTWFQPQPWPFQKIIPTGEDVIMIAVTGFVGMERTAIKVLVTAMGATYTDTLTPSNTHLIINNNNNNNNNNITSNKNNNSVGGAKYRKALEWNIHIVTIEWLHYILQYGFYGKHSSDENQQGCEHFFSPTTQIQSQTIDTNATAKITEQENPTGIKHNKAAEDRLRKTLQSLETPLSNKIKNTNRRVRRSPRRQIQLKGQDVEDDENDDEDDHLNFSVEPSRQNKRDLNNDSMIESQAIWYGNQTQYP